MTSRSERSPRRAAPSPPPVLLELSPTQVAQVVRAATGGGALVALLSQVHEIGAPVEVHPAWMEDLKLSRSLLNGLIVLAALPADGSYVGNAELARMVNLTPSTAHRYLTTLVTVGFADRDAATRKYRLTPPSDAERPR